MEKTKKTNKKTKRRQSKEKVPMDGVSGVCSFKKKNKVVKVISSEDKTTAKVLDTLSLIKIKVKDNEPDTEAQLLESPANLVDLNKLKLKEEKLNVDTPEASLVVIEAKENISEVENLKTIILLEMT